MIKEIKKLTAQIEAQSMKTAPSKAAVKKLISANPEQLYDFLLSLSDYWKIIKLVLQLVKVFTGPKADKKIDEIIAWGNENL